MPRGLLLCSSIAAATLSLGAASVSAQSPLTAQSPTVDFRRDVQPILAGRCYACHGPDEHEAGLRFDDQETVYGELDSGEVAIVPGEPELSALLYRVAAEDEFSRMPPEGEPLSDDEIAVLTAWIEQGAAWQGHWAFEPRRSVEPPRVADDSAVANPIDAFIQSRLEQAGLESAPPADRRTLLRRVYFDLTGLPPSPEEVEAFVADESPDAYEQRIDRLLESERYGERWARHWLDVVRFAETNSYERDGVKPNAWKYRDYVIRSFNDDKPYDQFLREQLAGDELEGSDRETIVATGFYRLGRWDDEPADRALAVYDEFDDIVTVVAQGMLGLTVNCARCHDHKIDPIPQKDYYSLLAFFRGLGGHGDGGRFPDKYSQVDVTPPEIAAAHQANDAEMERVRTAMRAIEQAGIEKMSAEDQRRSEGNERRRLLREKLADYLDDDQQTRYDALGEELRAVRRAREELPPRERVLGVAFCDPTPPETHVLIRGMPQAEGEAVPPAFPTLFGEDVPEIPEVENDALTSGRRRVLADWIASDDNRLTARVIVNRIWQHHFGRGIVRSSNNFGQLGVPPTHPELLDWLAERFVAAGWKMKPFHRLILTSNAYRRSSQAVEASLAADPNNDLFWRFDMRRLSAEEIRDSILAVGGTLNDKMYGPGFYPEVSEEVMAGQSMPGKGWGDSSPEEQARRSVYIHVKRSLVTPLLETFDFPETDSSCEARFVTVQPQQAFALLHGDFNLRQAEVLAERLRGEGGDDVADQVRRGLELAYSRPADPATVERFCEMIAAFRDEHGASADETLKLFCLALYSTNQFLYLD